MIFTTKRIYSPPSINDSQRILVDRLWPRGISKEAAQLDDWWKEVAPSHELRKWFHQQAQEWGEFVQKYEDELHANTKTLKSYLQKLDNQIPVTLLYGAKDEARNHALVLKKFIEALT